MERSAQVHRVTKETNINLNLNLDGNGNSNIVTPIGFLNHMLNLFSFHSKINLDIYATGDIEVCDHHLVEDVAITIGLAIKEALGQKLGIKRYGTFYIPMDESLAMASLDISGRPFIHFQGEFKRESIGNFSTEMVLEFFRALAFNAGITLHLRVIYGENDHHKIEAIFKAFGRALGEGVIVQGQEVSSTKGVL